MDFVEMTYPFLDLYNLKEEVKKKMKKNPLEPFFPPYLILCPVVRHAH